MRRRILEVLAALALFAGPAAAETLEELLRARGVPPSGALPHLDRPIETSQVLDDEQELLVVYAVRRREPAPLHAALWQRGPRKWTAATLAVGGPAGSQAPDGAGCRTGLVIDRFRSLDGRWADAGTWASLGRAVAVPDEFTEVVHVYSGLRRPDRVQHRELLRHDFEARFGPGAPGRALEPAVVREIFRTAGN